MDREADRRESPRAWWRRQLAGLDAALNLPAGRLQGPGTVMRLERLTAPVGGPGGCLETLDLVAARPSREVDLAVLLAGVAALCGHLTSRTDLGLGAWVRGGDGRSGLAVVRFRLSAGSSFGDLFTQARERIGEAVRWGPVPQDLAGPTDGGRHPLTQVVVAARSRGDAVPDAASLRIAPEAPQFDLAWILDRSADPASLVLEYASPRFGESGPGLLRALQSLLAAGLSDPSVPLATLAGGALPVA